MKKRTVNKKLISALIAYDELNLEKIGQKCDPPVSKPAISMFLNDKFAPDRLRSQITDILAGVVNDLFWELTGIQNGNISEILFPYSQDNPNNISITEEKQDAFPERKENFHDKTGASGFCGEADTAPHVGGRE